jgi:hypothetical protein
MTARPPYDLCIALRRMSNDDDISEGDYKTLREAADFIAEILAVAGVDMPDPLDEIRF